MGQFIGIARTLALLLPLALSGCGGSSVDSLEPPEEAEIGSARAALVSFPKEASPAGGGRHLEARLAQADPPE